MSPERTSQSQIPASVPRTARSNRSSLWRGDCSTCALDDPSQNIGDRTEEPLIRRPRLLTGPDIQIQETNPLPAERDGHTVMAMGQDRRIQDLMTTLDCINKDNFIICDCLAAEAHADGDAVARVQDPAGMRTWAFMTSFIEPSSNRKMHPLASIDSQGSWMIKSWIRWSCSSRGIGSSEIRRIDEIAS